MDDRNRGGALGRRGFFKVAAGGLAGAGIVAASRAAEGAERPARADDEPGAEARAPGSAPTAQWVRRRVDRGEVAAIEVLAPGVREGVPVTVAVYRRSGTFRRFVGAASARVQGGEARLHFDTARIGPVEEEGVVHLCFRVRVWSHENRIHAARDLEVLCARPRFSA